MADLCDACRGEVHTLCDCGRCGERWMRRIGFSGDFAWVR